MASKEVSIQLIAPASGARLSQSAIVCSSRQGMVSIQLIAPASGALRKLFTSISMSRVFRFHSTDCPSEWGLTLLQLGLLIVTFPFN